MANFDYSIIFYKNNIFSLDDIKLFKEKVEEAKKVDRYFFDIIPNINHIRNYIIYSYIFDKDLTIVDRINYIKGLVYASDYVDLEDLECLSEDMRFLNNFEYNPEEQEKQNGYNYMYKKSSIWKFTSYFSKSNQADFLEHLDEETLIEIEVQNKTSKELLEDDDFKRQLDNSNVKYVKLVETEDNKDAPEQVDDDFISVEDKIDLFENNIENYISKTMLLKIKEGKITNRDMPAIIAGMDKWFEFIFGSMKDIIELENSRLEYINENIFKLL